MFSDRSFPVTSMREPKKEYKENLETPVEGVFDFEYVVDLEKRIADYPERIKKIYRECESKIDELLKIQKDQGPQWNLYMENKADKVICHTAKSNRGLDIVREFIEYDLEPIWVIRSYLNIENRYKYDKLIAKCSILETLGVNLWTLYQRVYRIGFVAGR